MSTLTQRYAEALLPDRTVILGRRLQPYCIGHALLLHRMGSPYVFTGGSSRDISADSAGSCSDIRPGLGDLLLALWVCSRHWRVAAECIDNRRTRWLLRLWAFQFKLQSVIFDVQSSLIAAEDALRWYLYTAWDGPALWEGEERGPRSGAPVLASLKVQLMSLLARTEEQALSTPIRAALFDCAAYAEAEGALRWVSEEDLANFEEAQRRN